MKFFALRCLVISLVLSCIQSFSMIEVGYLPSYNYVNEGTFFEDMRTMDLIKKERTIFTKIMNKFQIFSTFESFKIFIKSALLSFPVIFIASFLSVFLYRRDVLRRNDFPIAKEGSE